MVHVHHFIPNPSDFLKICLNQDESMFFSSSRRHGAPVRPLFLHVAPTFVSGRRQKRISFGNSDAEVNGTPASGRSCDRGVFRKVFVRPPAGAGLAPTRGLRSARLCLPEKKYEKIHPFTNTTNIALKSANTIN